MAVETYCDVDIILGWGYRIALHRSNGEILAEYSAGDYPGESQTFSTGIATMEELRGWAQDSAQTLMEEHGITGLEPEIEEFESWEDYQGE